MGEKLPVFGAATYPGGGDQQAVAGVGLASGQGCAADDAGEEAGEPVAAAGGPLEVLHESSASQPAMITSTTASAAHALVTLALTLIAASCGQPGS
jgi:hypothetical protein